MGNNNRNWIPAVRILTEKFAASAVTLDWKRCVGFTARISRLATAVI
jgi:hypothetical protein